jgi:hypothetical protein
MVRLLSIACLRAISDPPPQVPVCPSASVMHTYKTHYLMCTVLPISHQRQFCDTFLDFQFETAYFNALKINIQSSLQVTAMCIWSSFANSWCKKTFMLILVRVTHLQSWKEIHRYRFFHWSSVHPTWIIVCIMPLLLHFDTSMQHLLCLINLL